MLDFDTIINKERMPFSGDRDGLVHGKRKNRLFGLYDLLFESGINKGCSIVCELGSHVGSSTALFAYCSKLVFAVDVWENIGVDYIEAFEHEFDRYIGNNFQNVVKIKGRTLDIAPMIPPVLDLVYIDADHSYEAVKQDIIKYIPKIVPGGILAGHDYFPELGNIDVAKAVDELLGGPDKVYEDSSWIKRIPNKSSFFFTEIKGWEFKNQNEK